MNPIYITHRCTDGFALSQQRNADIIEAEDSLDV